MKQVACDSSYDIFASSAKLEFFKVKQFMKRGLFCNRVTT